MMETAASTGIALNGALNGAPHAAPKAQPARDPALEKAAKAFESIFLHQMISAMRSSSMGEGIFDSSATEQFRDMADTKTAESMAETGKFGVAELLIQQFGARATAPSLSATPDIALGQQPAVKGNDAP